MNKPVIFCMSLMILVALAYMHGYERGYSDAEKEHGIKE